LLHSFLVGAQEITETAIMVHGLQQRWLVQMREYFFFLVLQIGQHIRR
jgi:hypothetical protein